MDWPDLLAGRPQPLVMGILNVTPDSFSDGGQFFSADRAVDRALRMADEGADLIDVGGESTRPASYGVAEEVAAAEEIRRVVPVLERLAPRLRVPLSVDTRKAAVARAALSAGAAVVNDVTAFRFDPEMAAVVAGSASLAILMHMRGTDPARMQEDLVEGDPFAAVLEGLGSALAAARRAGVEEERMAVDPGLGFGKTPGQNLRLLAQLSRLRALGRPVAVGASRKGFVRKFSGVAEDSSAAERLAGSLACVALAAEQGVALVRVHDVAATVGFLEAGIRSEWNAAAAQAGAAPEPFAKMMRALRSAGPSQS